jgi:DHA1 family bicyclomycin/chloramphenicol resistance-like MFS transporter
MGVTLPNAQTLALLRVRHSAGSASALLGTTSFAIGAVASPLVGVAGEDTAVPMAVVQLVAAVVALGFFVGMCRPWKDTGAARDEGRAKGLSESSARPRPETGPEVGEDS